MTATQIDPTYVEALTAAEHLGVGAYDLGHSLATRAVEVMRSRADYLERQRDNGMKDGAVADFDEHMEYARRLLVAAEACFDACRRDAA